MMKLVYIGNFLNRHGFTPSMGETLVKFLSNDGRVVQGVSSHRNQILRFVDMVGVSLFHSKSKSVFIIDLFSSKAKWFAIITGFILNKRKIPYVIVLRGGGLPEIKENILLGNVLNKSRSIVAPSHYLYDSFCSRFSQTRLIPNFIQLDDYNFVERKRVSASFLWVRSLHKVYNPLMLVDIASGLVKLGIDCHFYVVGPDKDGTEGVLRRRLKEASLEKNFSLLGLLSKAEWRGLNSKTDIFLNTTDYDNMPVSVIEAMALGFPVVSTNVGGLPKLIENGHNGILLPRRSPEMFISSIVRLLNDADLANKLSINARESAENYSWEKVKLSWINLIK